MSPPRVLLSALVLSILGCEGRLMLGARCTWNSDCEDHRSCAGGFCRAECREDRDCPGSGETCVRFSGEGGVCAPPSTAVPCALPSDCGPGVRCVSGTCRAECASDDDCAAAGTAGTCASGVCSEALVTPPMPGDGGAIDCRDGWERCPGEGFCRDLSSDPESCGECGASCGGEDCLLGGCRAPNDECSGAIELDLSSGSARISGSGPTGWSDSSGSCNEEPDAFYRFTLADRRLVWAVATSNGATVRVGITEACGGAPLGCGYPAGTSEAVGEAVGVVEPGEHWVSVDVGSDATWSLRLYSVAVGEAPVAPLDLDAIPEGAPVILTGTTVGGSDSTSSCDRGSDAAFWFRIDPTPTGLYWHTYVVRTCGSGAFDSTLGLVRADGGAPICATADTCGAHGELQFTLDAATDPEGLYVLFVDGATPTDAGDFTLEVERLP